MSSEAKSGIRCAVYTRKSSEEGLEQSFNSLDAQQEACPAFISSQKQEGWRFLKTPSLHSREPAMWLHEIFRTNGQPYSEEEVAFIKHLTGRNSTQNR
jgi:hypothetical protein